MYKKAVLSHTSRSCPYRGRDRPGGPLLYALILSRQLAVVLYLDSALYNMHVPVVFKRDPRAKRDELPRPTIRVGHIIMAQILYYKQVVK